MLMILYCMILKTEVLLTIMMTMTKIQLLLEIAILHVMDHTILKTVINAYKCKYQNFNISNLSTLN